MPPKIIFIVGPTAVGKTDVALALAKKFNSEIVSCDSMQIYREISIASNKPSQTQLKKIPHHLMDIISVEEDFNVAAFYQKAVPLIEKCLTQNKTILIVGGSGLYMQILLDGIFEETAKNISVREKLMKEIEVKGPQVLYDRLTKVDPKAAAKIHVHDARRIVRALEVFMLKDEPISQLQKKRNGLWGKYDIVLFALNRDRKELYAQIDERVEQMFTHGLVEEVKQLQKLKLSKTVQGMIGLKEVCGFLNGEYDLDRAKYLMKRNTRHFAKRQLTWFRKEKRLQWIDVKSSDTTEDIVKQIVAQAREDKI